MPNLTLFFLYHFSALNLDPHKAVQGAGLWRRGARGAALRLQNRRRHWPGLSPVAAQLYRQCKREKRAFFFSYSIEFILDNFLIINFFSFFWLSFRASTWRPLMRMGRRRVPVSASATRFSSATTSTSPWWPTRRRWSSFARRPFSSCSSPVEVASERPFSPTPEYTLCFILLFYY